MKNKTLGFILLQIAIFLFAFSNVFFKIASNFMAEYGLFSFECLCSMAGGILVLVIYALLWQQILKIYELNVANAIKTLYLIWGVFFAIVFFKEKYQWNNFLGLLCIILGIIIIIRNKDVKK
ncbi:drug/metabolite transporter (DMT)-like permease [Aequitasia blattaphilus]|uniref:EamA family transporter n=1 Tax=Aequitasia blattaphilus TaxID=2949332 RepID=A0ABT1E8D9_9FIRM|nr:EamA family transporter [Aequitasia blattaphilus]MCP1101252.1 EamA family transporter [Aequitasia blattaphilus]MCR8613892.1 EamA family transporter [Aequitasia blattaphilus]